MFHLLYKRLYVFCLYVFNGNTNSLTEHFTLPNIDVVKRYAIGARPGPRALDDDLVDALWQNHEEPRPILDELAGGIDLSPHFFFIFRPNCDAWDLAKARLVRLEPVEQFEAHARRVQVWWRELCLVACLLFCGQEAIYVPRSWVSKERNK